MTLAGIHMGYDNGNNVTWTAANGLKVFEILTFGPIRKHWNLAFLASRNLSILFKIRTCRGTVLCRVSGWKTFSHSRRENSILYPDFL